MKSPMKQRGFVPRAGLGSLCLLWFWSILAANGAWAVTVPDLYEVTVPAGADRDAAFVEALKAVVVRVSGRRDAAAQLGPISNPRQYVQRFGSTADKMLQVGFDSVSIDRLLTDAGLPIWGRERPATLVLLYVTASNGSSYWIDGNAVSAERDEVNRAARQRGLPIVWADASAYAAVTDPSMSAELLQTAARYNANATLLGQARSDGAGGLTVRWTLASADENASTSGSLEDGVHLAADAFARVYSASGSSLDSLALDVSGIDSLAAYASTLNYLEGMTLVRSVAVEQVSGDTMKFRLAVRGDATTLRRALALDGRLQPLTGVDAAQPADRLQFRYQP